MRPYFHRVESRKHLTQLITRIHLKLRARSLIIGILLFDPACFYYPDEWSFTVLLVMSSRTSCIQIISPRSCAVTMARNEGGQTKERERLRWKANTAAHDSAARETVVHGDICAGAPRVCGSRNGNRSSSILAVAFEDRYTPPVSRHRWRSTARRRRRRWRLVDPRFTFRTNRGGATLRSVRSLTLRKLCFTRIKMDVKCRQRHNEYIANSNYRR
jgi:hypothetical protein